MLKMKGHEQETSSVLENVITSHKSSLLTCHQISEFYPIYLLLNTEQQEVEIYNRLQRRRLLIIFSVSLITSSFWLAKLLGNFNKRIRARTASRTDAITEDRLMRRVSLLGFCCLSEVHVAWFSIQGQVGICGRSSCRREKRR